MMDNIAFFPNTSSPSNSAPSDMLANLAALGGEAGDGLSFDALMTANASADTSGLSAHAAPQGAAPATPQAGSFEDVSVILQLLRVAQNEAAPQGSASADLGAALAPTPDAALNAATPLPSAPDIATALTAEAQPNPAPHPLLMAQMQRPRIAKADALMTSSDGAEISAQKPEAAALGHDANSATTQSLPATEGDIAAMLLALQNTPAPTSSAPAASALAFAAAQWQTDGSALPNSGESEAELLPSSSASAAAQGSSKAAAPVTSSAASMVLQNLTGHDVSAATVGSSRSAALPRELTANSATLPAAIAPAASANTAALESQSAMNMLLSQTAPATAESVSQVKQGLVDFGERLLEIGNDDAWIDQLAKDIAATKSSNGHISFRLMPANLGRIDVAMLQNDQGVSVHVDAQNENAASLVAASQVRLVEELRQQGVRVNHTEVTYTANETGRHAGQEQGRGQNPAAAPFIETAPEFAPHGQGNEKGDAQPQGRYA